MEVVVGREVCGLLGCGDKIFESASPGDDVIQVIHSSPRIHRGGFLNGPIWVTRIPLGGFVRHVELGNVISRDREILAGCATGAELARGLATEAEFA